MKPSQTLLLLSSFSIYYTQVSGYWRTACSTVQTARIDPILAPGNTSPHVHKLAGASNVNQYSDYDSLQSTQCSSCEVQDDHSAYWTPQLYYAHSNGTFQEVRNEGMTVYYVGRGGNSSTTVPFPPGFKMLSGDSIMRSYDSETLTYLNTRPVADRHYMFDTNCVNGMRAQVNFQSCWDGVNLFLPDNKHVDYLSGIDYGVCSPEYPVSIPGLFFEVLYWTNEIDQSAGGQFVFAQGDTTGYGFHGDFLNGWNMDTQTAAVSECLYVDDGGVVSACAALAASDDVNFSRDCLPQPPLNSEPVLGFLTQLPGCNPITSGPDPAPQLFCPLNSNTPEAINSSATTTATSFSSSSTSVAADSSTYISSTSLTGIYTTSSTSPFTALTTDFATSFTTYFSTAFTTDSATVSPTSTTTSSINSAAASTSVFFSTSTSTSSLLTDATSITTSTTSASSSFSTTFVQSLIFTTSSTAAAETSGGEFYGVFTDSATVTTSLTSVDTATTVAGPFVTTFITITQPITENITLTIDTTVVPMSLTTAATTMTLNNTFFRGRRRAFPRTRQY